MKDNPALLRIQQLRARSLGSRNLDAIVGEDFTNPLIIAAQEIGQERLGLPKETLPPLEEDQDLVRVAQRLLQIQTDQLGSVALTNTRKYTEESKVDAVEAFKSRLIGV